MPITNNKSQLSDDLTFLIACCQTEPTPEERQCILTHLSHSTIHSPPSTHPLITAAAQHGILPLVYKALKAHISATKEEGEPNTLHPPSTIHYPLSTLISGLKARYQTIAQRNILMSAELLRIMKLLEENGIEALAFKGPALAQMAYGDITLRQYSDLDILVDVSDAYRAGKLMSENGHTPVLSLAILSNKTCLQAAKDFSLMSDSGGVHTELHWRLFEKKYALSILSCASQEKCQNVSINGRKVLTLQNELLLVYLCLHGAKHAFGRIEWICDIHRLIRSGEIDWQEATAIADHSHSSRSFYLGLSLAHHLFRAPLPSEVIKRIDADEIQVLQSMTLQQISGGNNKKSDFEKNRNTFFYQSKLFDQKSDMLRFYLSTFFNISTTDCQTFLLPKYLKFLYLFLRPVRLIFTYGKRVFGA